MHGRPLTQVDELVLAVETQRIWDRIRSSRRH
jgi:hypothetical protein